MAGNLCYEIPAALGESQPHKSAHMNVHQSVSIEVAENLLHKITPSAQKNMYYTS